MPGKHHQLTTEETLQRTHSVFAELRKYAEGEPRLIDFVPSLIELQEQARLLAQAGANVPPLRSTPASTMPSRALAVKVTEIVSKLPPVEKDFDSSKREALANLLENLVVAITGTIFGQFPDVKKKKKAEVT